MLQITNNAKIGSIFVFKNVLFSYFLKFLYGLHEGFFHANFQIFLKILKMKFSPVLKTTLNLYKTREKKRNFIKIQFSQCRNPT